MLKKIENKKITEKKWAVKKNQNFSQWYNELILRAELASYAPVKGCMVIRPYGYSIWENIQRILDGEIKKIGAKNAYFPLFIPENFLKKEKEHVKGFSPELAVVTIGGGERLKEKLIVRPTSETIIYQIFKDWIQSWRDLPYRINQWCNVVRWEKRPRLFLRTTEFLWQEGHTCHRDEKETKDEVKKVLKMYLNLYQNYLAIDGIAGKKSELEKFPGAKETYTYEMLMPDGKALQGCTVHNLGQNFSKVFKIRFRDKDQKEKLVWQTSWGFTTRSVGALVMVHGDDLGLILPPRIAPIQIIIIPIFTGKKVDKKLEEKAKETEEILKDFRVQVDLSKEHSPGWKFNEWELKGVPLRIEIGEKEIKKAELTLVRRDNRERNLIKEKEALKKIPEILESIQEGLFEKSSKFLKENTREVMNFEEFKEILEKKKGFIKAFWCEKESCEIKIKEITKATPRCLPLNSKREKGKCVFCKKPAFRKWIFAQAY
jgi:prolyl-tRNA synthetase